MNSSQFWNIIEQAKEVTENRWQEMFNPVVEQLMQLNDEELMCWDNIFWEYQQLSYKNKLWAAAYVINGGCSDDGFDYFRAWLTAEGKDVFMNALKNPDSLADVENCEEDVEYEEFLSVACCAFLRKNGHDDNDIGVFYQEKEKYPLSEQLKAEMRKEIQYAADIDVEWDEDNEEELERLVPNLFAKFW